MKKKSKKLKKALKKRLRKLVAKHGPELALALLTRYVARVAGPHPKRGGLLRILPSRRS